MLSQQILCLAKLMYLRNNVSALNKLPFQKQENYEKYWKFSVNHKRIFLLILKACFAGIQRT